MGRLLKYIFILLLLSSCGANRISKRFVKSFHEEQDTVRVLQNQDSLRVLSNKDYLIRNRYNTWELYVSGSPYVLGNRTGLLMDELFRKQQQIFMDKLETLVPTRFKRKLVSSFIHWYGRRLDDYIPKPYLEEMYGLSAHLKNAYPYAGDNFSLTLFMHAAHDLGHAMRDLAIVGCSSVASWGNNTADGKLLIGRNFDFYIGDEFAENKVVAFVRPQKGIPFMSVSWPGMIGVVSGMNKEGLTVTMNAGKSTIPLSAKKPISILAREILERASNIAEAVQVAQEAKSFVSESLMIGSAKDGKAVLLEISPKNFGIYEVENGTQLICTNHFQSDTYLRDERNMAHIRESHSQYRYDRMKELLSRTPKLTAETMASILRNRQGVADEDIGMGNDKSLNHLLAHHSIIFKPEDRLVWVSNAPYQLGAFTAYDLNKIFVDEPVRAITHGIDSLTIREDPFLKTTGYRAYEQYRCEVDEIENAIKNGNEILEHRLINFKEFNPDLWLVYYIAGKYWYSRGEFEKAANELNIALKKEIPTVQAKEELEKLWKKANKRTKK